jgi:hypothetical protein
MRDKNNPTGNREFSRRKNNFSSRQKNIFLPRHLRFSDMAFFFGLKCKEF